MSNGFTGFGSHVLIIDGAHMLRRSIHQPSLRDLTSSQGVPSGAVYGFMNSLKSSINNLQATAVVVCWEGGHSERRKELLPTYKVHHSDGSEPDRDVHGMTDYEYYKHQLQWVEMILETLAIPQVRVLGKEGDDVLFQVIRLLRAQKTIISEDRDFCSLVDHDVSLYRPVKKELITLDNFEQVTSYRTPKHFLYAKVVLGDGSDEIPSVAKGVGEKTIHDILSKIPDPDEVNIQRILTEAATFGKARYNKLIEAGESPIRRNLDLIDISKETFDVIELLELCKTLEVKKYPNVDMATKIMQRLEFNPDNIGYLVSRLSRMSDFTLASIVDKTFIKDKMLNQTSVMQG